MDMASVCCAQSSSRPAPPPHHAHYPSLSAHAPTHSSPFADRKGCVFNETYNAYICTPKQLLPARLVVDLMAPQAFGEPRRFTPVTFATNGYVDFLNGGYWLVPQFSTIVAINRT